MSTTREALAHKIICAADDILKIIDAANGQDVLDEIHKNYYKPLSLLIRIYKKKMITDKTKQIIESYLKSVPSILASYKPEIKNKLLELVQSAYEDGVNSK